MEKEYVKILLESIQKKDLILGELLKCTNQQTEIVKSEEVDWDAFNDMINKKESFVNDINKLDEGFETLFERVKNEINSNKEKYADDIKKIKLLIKAVTEKGTEIEVIEKRNKDLIENRFNETRNDIKQRKLGNRVAVEYYQKMNRINTIDPQLMDKNC